MHTTCYRFEIMNTKTIRKIVAIITNNIKRMCGIHEFVYHAFFFYFDNEITFFIVRF